jgi:hypothetical protein
MRCAVVKDQTRFSFVAVEFAVLLELWEEDPDEPFVKDYDATLRQHQKGNGWGDR